MAEPNRFADLLTQPNVDEVLELRSARLGFMAYHGGQLEKVTDVVADEAAARSGASYYGLLQTDEDRVVHVPSATVDPSASDRLGSFIGHVDAAITLHGYGRKRLWHAVLLGGRNRELADVVARSLRRRLPDYHIIDRLDEVPRALAGQHVRNPVNLPPSAGVQIELPPTLRWNRAGRHWSDLGAAGRAPQVEALIDALADAAGQWMDRN